MITLITGTPGAGKTALALAMLLDEGKGQNRPLYVSGVKDLAITHEPMPEVAKWTTWVDAPETPEGKKLVFDPAEFAERGVLLIDEAQNVYRPRAASSKVPDYVAALETHRHLGLDIWLVTQNPGLLDANVRKLVTRHIHIKRNILGGRRLYEWTDEIGDVESRTSRDLAASRKYKPPKRVFSLYTSATAHTKVPRRLPIYAYVLVFGLLILAGLSWRIYGSIKERVAGSKPTADEQAKSAPQGVTGLAPGTPGGAAQAQPVSWSEAQTPRVSGLPHTAPQFDQLTTPRAIPFPSACVASKSKCTCYTDQATILQVEDDMCRQIVAGGLYEAHRDPEKVRRNQTIMDARVASKAPVEPEGGIAAIPDTFNGSHVGTVESTRVVGRARQAAPLPNNQPPASSTGRSGDRPVRNTLNATS